MPQGDADCDARALRDAVPHGEDDCDVDDDRDADGVTLSDDDDDALELTVTQSTSRTTHASSSSARMLRGGTIAVAGEEAGWAQVPYVHAPGASAAQARLARRPKRHARARQQASVFGVAASSTGCQRQTTPPTPLLQPLPPVLPGGADMQRLSRAARMGCAWYAALQCGLRMVCSAAVWWRKKVPRVVVREGGRRRGENTSRASPCPRVAPQRVDAPCTHAAQRVSTQEEPPAARPPPPAALSGVRPGRAGGSPKRTSCAAAKTACSAGMRNTSRYALQA